MARDNRAFLITVILLGACAPGRAAEPAPAVPGVTLRECYDWAKERSEALRIRREDIVRSKERARGSIGTALPDLSWELVDTIQDPAGVDRLAARGFSGFVQKEQVDSRFSITQPLFSGFQEMSAYSGFKREVARDTLLLDTAARALYEETALAFYLVLLHESDRENTRLALSLAEDRVKELRGFLRLGKARDSEIFTAEAQAAAMRARIQDLQAQINSSREDLSFLTGRDLSAAALKDEIEGVPDGGDLAGVLAQAVDRVDIRAQREDVAAKAMLVRYEKGRYWPTADLRGSYYTKRANFLDEIQWDLQLALRMPIFQGGIVGARVREAQAVHRQALLALTELERRVVYRARKVHGELAAGAKEVRALEEAASAAQKSYRSLREEYRLGLVTNLEVLAALDLLQSQKSAYDAARLKTKRLFIRLQVALEKLP